MFVLGLGFIVKVWIKGETPDTDLADVEQATPVAVDPYMVPHDYVD